MSLLRPLPFVWPYALLFWAVFVWAYSPEFGIVRRAQRDQTATDSRSLQVIMFGQMFAFVAAFAVYLYRINVEERTLLGVIGEPYREFMRTRKRLIPFIY